AERVVDRVAPAHHRGARQRDPGGEEGSGRSGRRRHGRHVLEPVSGRSNGLKAEAVAHVKGRPGLLPAGLFFLLSPPLSRGDQASARRPRGRRIMPTPPASSRSVAGSGTVTTGSSLERSRMSWISLPEPL